MFRAAFLPIISSTSALVHFMQLWRPMLPGVGWRFCVT